MAEAAEAVLVGRRDDGEKYVGALVFQATLLDTLEHEGEKGGQVLGAAVVEERAIGVSVGVLDLDVEGGVDARVEPAELVGGARALDD